MIGRKKMTPVQRGARMLDQRMPGWENNINVDRLNIGSNRRCILGQLFGDYATGAHQLRGRFEIRFGTEYGFLVWDHEERKVEQEWAREIAARLDARDNHRRLVESFLASKRRFVEWVLVA